MRIFSAVFLAWLSFAAIAADVYRWVDSQGVVHYSDKPQAPNDKPVALPHLQTYAAGSGAPAFTAAETGSPAKTAAAPISISSPAPDETIRDAEGKFTVTVAANPGPGEGLVYFLDGVAQNSQPTPSTALLFSGVERGQHSISAALIGGDGEQLARSADVTINMKPPSVRH